jgi:hypothetical protein
MGNAPHDIIMEALDLMGREVKLFTQSAGHWGSVGIFWGTVSGVSEKGTKATVTIDDFRAGYADSERVDHMLLDASTIIHIEPLA